MVAINYAFREISCKIVYYGPGLSGKTTNLQYVHDRLPASSRGDLISLATEADRTLYFDFLPLNVGDIGGFATKFQMYTVPGQVFYNATRKLVLRGVDGLVFVADSQQAKMDENLESLADMYDNLRSYNIDPAQIPIVMQYNKRDLPEIATIEELETKLNPQGGPYIEACASNGVGVFDTVKCVSKMVLEHLRNQTVTAPTGASGAESARPAAVSSRADVPERVAVAAAAAVRPAPGHAARVRSAANAVPERPVPDSPRSGAGQRSPAAAALRPEAARAAASRPGRIIVAAQKSTRVRRRRRSLFGRLFGWLAGR
jgi:hypothetical protein